jgi:hypothetical protein
MATKIVSADAIAKCPQLNLSPDHFREDGTCKCFSAKTEQRGTAPLYALWSTKDIKGAKIVSDTLGNTQGFGSVTVKVGTNHGGFQIVARENGDFELAFIPWQSRVGTVRGTKRLLTKGNLRDIEDLFPPKPQMQDMPLWEQQAHKEYADAQDEED